MSKKLSARDYYIRDLKLANISEEEIEDHMEWMEEEMPMVFAFAENYAMHKVAEYVREQENKK